MLLYVLWVGSHTLSLSDTTHTQKTFSHPDICLLYHIRQQGGVWTVVCEVIEGDPSTRLWHLSEYKSAIKWQLGICTIQAHKSKPPSSRRRGRNFFLSFLLHLTLQVRGQSVVITWHHIMIHWGKTVRRVQEWTFMFKTVSSVDVSETFKLLYGALQQTCEHNQLLCGFIIWVSVAEEN